VPCEVSRMWFSAGTRAATGKGVNRHRLARLTPTSRSFGLYMWG
jgi:hypothetical protein